MATSELTKCIVTGSENLIRVVNLGDLYPSAFLNDPKEEKKFQKKPFIINFCEDSGMVQLKYVHEYDDMFKDYWYRSATNSQMRKSLRDIANSTLDKHKSHVMNWLDIACNDGTLSSIVKDINSNIQVVGVDPALNLNHSGSDVFVNDYFTSTAVKAAVGEDAKFDVITNIAMFYDLQSPHGFLEGVKELLAPEGIYVIQMTDLWGMLKSNAVDNFCHEHVAYYSLAVMDKLLKQHGLEIFDIEYNTTNGSSLRLYICHPGAYERREMVDMMIEYQKKDITEKAIVEWYNNNICRNLYIFKRWLERQKKDGKSIALIGASTKGNTLLQMCDIDHRLIDYAMELSDFKFGKYTLGSNIPIVDEKLIMDAKRIGKPDICVAAIWHFKDSILKNFDKYIQDGGSVLFPLPKPMLYTKTGVVEIK